MDPRIDIVFPVLPPKFDGIGDHTAHLSAALADYASVRVLTAQSDTAPIPNVEIVQAFSLDRRRGIRALQHVVRADPPDWLLLQFNQFSYGRWGLNPYLPLTMRRLAKALPETRIAVLFHEDFVPVTSWKNAIMTTWQRWQFWSLGRSADLILFSISPWIEEYRSWFPGTPIRHLPVGSNMPRTGASREEMRQRLGIDRDTFVVGYFGTIHGSRYVHLFREATRSLRQRARDMLVLYVGADGDALSRYLDEDVPFYDAGPLPAEDVSAHFAAMDVHLAPIVDGVSTRRGAFMAGIQHGVATVATKGTQTDDLLARADGEAFLLADVDDARQFVDHVMTLFQNPERRAELGHEGQALYDAHFDWPIIANRLLDAMRTVELSMPTPSQSIGRYS